MQKYFFEGNCTQSISFKGHPGRAIYSSESFCEEFVHTLSSRNACSTFEKKTAIFHSWSGEIRQTKSANTKSSVLLNSSGKGGVPGSHWVFSFSWDVPRSSVAVLILVVSSLQGTPQEDETEQCCPKAVVQFSIKQIAWCILVVKPLNHEEYPWISSFLQCNCKSALLGSPILYFVQ